jgi:ABC-2 type transport system ATP-binding protein
VIRTEHLSREYGPKVALSDLNLRVDPGEILGFLGPNGAGKSTTVKILTGMIRPTSGRASVAGFDIVEQPLEAKKRIGYVPETAALYDGLTAAEYLDLVSALHHLDRRTASSRSGELLELFGLANERHQRLSEFSKGMRQKVLIAASLIHRPDVLFLDEPLDGLDANAALVVKEVLKQPSRGRRSCSARTFSMSSSGCAPESSSSIRGGRSPTGRRRRFANKPERRLSRRRSAG